jgi:hypothetical protein
LSVSQATYFDMSALILRSSASCFSSAAVCWIYNNCSVQAVILSPQVSQQDYYRTNFAWRTYWYAPWICYNPLSLKWAFWGHWVRCSNALKILVNGLPYIRKASQSQWGKKENCTNENNNRSFINTVINGNRYVNCRALRYPVKWKKDFCSVRSLILFRRLLRAEGEHGHAGYP